MSNIKRYTLDEIERAVSRSDKERFEKTTEKEILEQIISDQDTPRLTGKELKEMRLASERRNEKK